MVQEVLWLTLERCMFPNVELASWFFQSNKALVCMELAVFSSVSQPDTQRNVYIQAGNRPQGCWNHLTSGLSFLSTGIWFHIGLASCDFSNFWFQTFSNLISYKNWAWMECLSPDVEVAMPFCFLVNGFYFWSPLFSNKAWVVLGPRGSWILNDPSCNKFPVKIKTWSILVTLHLLKRSLLGAWWIVTELIIGILLSSQMHVSSICEPGNFLPY